MPNVQRDLRRATLRGAAWTIALCYVPFAPLFGGSVAGRSACDEAERYRRGIVAGALAGLPAAVVLSALVVLGWLVVLGRAVQPSPAVLLLECLGLSLATTVYTVGLSAAGGLVGASGVSEATRRGGGSDGR